MFGIYKWPVRIVAIGFIARLMFAALPVLAASEDAGFIDSIELKLAEEAYDHAVAEANIEDICLAERHLAWVKLNEYSTGGLTLASDDLARLGSKQNQECQSEPESPFTAKKFYKKVTAGEDQNYNIRIASEISNNNLDFILTLEQENGMWTVGRFHGYNTNGTTDHGFCGLNSAYHSNYIGSEDFYNPWHQMQYCYSIFQRNPGRFYGYFKRFKHRNKFVLVNEQ